MCCSERFVEALLDDVGKLSKSAGLWPDLLSQHHCCSGLVCVRVRCILCFVGKAGSRKSRKMSAIHSIWSWLSSVCFQYPHLSRLAISTSKSSQVFQRRSSELCHRRTLPKLRVYLQEACRPRKRMLEIVVLGLTTMKVVLLFRTVICAIPLLI